MNGFTNSSRLPSCVNCSLPYWAWRGLQQGSREITEGAAILEPFITSMDPAVVSFGSFWLPAEFFQDCSPKMQGYFFPSMP